MEKAKLGHPVGAKMLIPSLEDVAAAVRAVPAGVVGDGKAVRQGLAESFGADVCCPFAWGKHLRAIGDEAWESLGAGASVGDVVPFWRVVDPGSTLGKKLACGSEWLKATRDGEVGVVAGGG